jgi:hypothetical protein
MKAGKYPAFKLNNNVRFPEWFLKYLPGLLHFFAESLSFVIMEVHQNEVEEMG